MSEPLTEPEMAQMLTVIAQTWQGWEPSVGTFAEALHARAAATERADQRARDLATADTRNEKLTGDLLRTERERDELRAAICTPEVYAGVVTRELERERGELQQAWQFVDEENEQNHQPAANYELLLARLAGQPTNHGDEPVAAYIDKIEHERDEAAAAAAAIVARLPKTADGMPLVEGMKAWTAAPELREVQVETHGRAYELDDAETNSWSPIDTYGRRVLYSTREAAEAAKGGKP